MREGRRYSIIEQRSRSDASFIHSLLCLCRAGNFQYVFSHILSFIPFNFWNKNWTENSFSNSRIYRMIKKYQKVSASHKKRVGCMKLVTLQIKGKEHS